MNKFYEEVLVSSDHDRGIAFMSLLMILVHYKVINDNKSLRLQEFLQRRALLQRVDEAVRRNIVIGFFDTVYWYRLFRRRMEHRNAGVMTAVPQFTVPEIYVEHDEEDSTGPSAQGDHLDPFSDRTPVSPTMGHVRGATTPPSGRSRAPTLRTGDRTNSIQETPTTSPTRSPTRSPPGALRRQGSDSDLGDGWRLSTLDVDEPVGGRSRAGSSVSAQDVLEVLDNSAWGESIRRSFTTRRQSRDGGRE